MEAVCFKLYLLVRTGLSQGQLAHRAVTSAWIQPEGPAESWLVHLE
jgi:hypothetical protein